jgi:hypothetical protein
MEVGSDRDEGASSWKSICVCCTCTSSRRSLLVTTTAVPVSTSSPFIIDVARASKGLCFSGASTYPISATTFDSLTYIRSKISLRRRATTPVSTAFPLQSLASRAAQRYLHCWTCSRLSTDVNRPPAQRTWLIETKAPRITLAQDRVRCEPPVGFASERAPSRYPIPQRGDRWWSSRRDRHYIRGPSRRLRGAR